mgnify:CR=1 FL=1
MITERRKDKEWVQKDNFLANLKRLNEFYEGSCVYQAK